jgi:hypothetical protein
MSDNTAIEWCDATWNPTTGCTKITTGCDRCYAARFAERFRNVPAHPYESGFDLTLRPERLQQPLSWKRPRMIFVDSMSDVFHKDIPLTYIDQVFDTMEAADWHRFQVITKRSSLMRNYARERYNRRSPPAHIWLGVSIEHAASKAGSSTCAPRLRQCALCRSSRCSGAWAGSTSQGFTGSYSAARRAQVHVRWRLSGRGKSGTNVWRSRSLSISSDGAVRGRKRAGHLWTGANGRSFQEHRSLKWQPDKLDRRLRALHGAAPLTCSEARL